VAGMRARLATALPLSPRIDSREDISPDVEPLVLGFRDDRADDTLPRHEQRVELALTAGFALAVTAIALLFERRAVPVDHALPLLVVYALASRVTFPVGAGYTVPTQLAFVPMLVLLPAASVPLVVCIAIVLGHLPDYVARRKSPLGLLRVPGDAWHAVAPALVLAAAGDHELGWNDWPLLAAAVAVQIASDATVSLARLRLVVGESPRLHLELLSWLYVVDLLLAPVGFLVAMAAVERPGAVLLLLPLVALMVLFAHEREARIDQALELSQAYRGTTLLLGDVLDEDHAYTGGHSRDVVTLARDVAREMGLDDRRRQLVEFGALLHDLGKIAVPKDILDKRGPLTEDEWLVIRTHTLGGQRMLDRVGGLLREVGRVVRSSHERWDGTGYPDGLKGDQIPLEAAIVCCCDAYDAMISHRPYREALPPHVALEEIAANAGRQFAPDVAATVATVLEGRQR
jgi:HD-GYP domain-containing protein (c-di-GMP phosphodiesterase class II)